MKLPIWLKPAVLALVIGMISSLVFFQAFRLKTIERELGRALETNARLEQAVEIQQETTEFLEREIAAVNLASRKLAARIAEAGLERQIAVKQLNDYRGRLENATLEKPELVERLANDALNRILFRIAEATGNQDNAD